LVRDLDRFEDETLIETLRWIASLRPDVLALQSVDYDHSQIALSRIQDRLAELGHAMPHRFARMPNAGHPTGFDLNRDGRLDTGSDRQGYGLFAGHGGIALLSRYPIVEEEARDFSDLLWRDLDGASLPADYFAASELAVLRLHGVAAWDVPVQLPGGVAHVLMVQASAPVFDGPEDRNGLRNADQIRFWAAYAAQLDAPFVLMGGLNNDPVDGEGLKPALHDLLSSPDLQDPQPRAAGVAGRDGLDTVDWGPEIGRMRVDYVLPSTDFGVAASAVEWQQPVGKVADLTPHKPVWVDLFWQ
jgi:endonuclease/exonuclease/phosphatase family metal-dependent hydrolase